MINLKLLSSLKLVVGSIRVVLVSTFFTGSVIATSISAQELSWPEKEELRFGFIKLTDMAPLAIAYEKGYFEEEGLYVTLEAQANWKVLLDRVIDGQLYGAHMLAGQLLGATLRRNYWLRY
jgi:nitrate/nitrite transport system substrate-binding protein